MFFSLWLAFFLYVGFLVFISIYAFFNRSEEGEDEARDYEKNHLNYVKLLAFPFRLLLTCAITLFFFWATNLNYIVDTLSDEFPVVMISDKFRNLIHKKNLENTKINQDNGTGNVNADNRSTVNGDRDEENAKRLWDAFGLKVENISSELVNRYRIPDNLTKGVIVVERKNPHSILPGDVIVAIRKGSGWIEELKKGATSFPQRLSPGSEVVGSPVPEERTTVR